MYSNRHRSRRTGFSLVELLVVLVILAVIVAISIPLLMDAKDEAKENALRRTAQIVASVAGNAQAAGNLTIGNAATESDAIELLSTGVLGGGVFEEVEYRVALSADEKLAVAKFLELRDGVLLFDASR